MTSMFTRTTPSHRLASVHAVWQHLAGTLVHAAMAAVDAHRKLKAVNEQRRLQLPHTLRELRRHRADHPSPKELHDFNENMERTRTRLLDAVLAIQQCAAVMEVECMPAGNGNHTHALCP